jgi:hypothetical protein
MHTLQDRLQKHRVLRLIKRSTGQKNAGQPLGKLAGLLCSICHASRWLAELIHQPGSGRFMESARGKVQGRDRFQMALLRSDLSVQPVRLHKEHAVRPNLLLGGVASVDDIGLNQDNRTALNLLRATGMVEDGFTFIDDAD